GNVLKEHSGNGFIRENGDMRYDQWGENRLEPLFGLGFTISGRDLKDRYLLTALAPGSWNSPQSAT
ncbi:hypothetical protein, partial [Congregibacter sp.]|uniref:hypothetical protein n=1 Tax=Congregibacter sp. TaxID=2744308 RepID=UPI0039E4F060